ncbi:MAG: prefoldin subunit alpha [Candidatus Hodarchaeales archaeon]|jgi:prefoldin alpha subunit
MTNVNMTPEVVKRVQVLQTEIEQLQINMNAIENQTSLITRAIDSLESAIATQKELEGKKEGDDILIPIGGSNLIHCTIKDPNKVFISLGAGISTHTSIKEAIIRNEDQAKNLMSSINNLKEQFSQLSQMTNVRRQELLQLAQQYQILD